MGDVGSKTECEPLSSETAECPWAGTGGKKTMQYSGYGPENCVPNTAGSSLGFAYFWGCTAPFALRSPNVDIEKCWELENLKLAVHVRCGPKEKTFLYPDQR